MPKRTTSADPLPLQTQARPASRAYNFIGPLGPLSTYQLLHMRFNLNPRFGDFRPFISLQSGDEGASGTLAAGVVTYTTEADGTESYRMSEIGGSLRSDHVFDAVQDKLGNETTTRLVSDDSSDAYAVGTLKQNEKKEQEAIEPTSEPAAA